jgi:hypothetical protein
MNEPYFISTSMVRIFFRQDIVVENYISDQIISFLLHGP